MKLFSVGPDGGEGSGVTGLYLIEIKSLFTIVLLRTSKGTREAYHNHAFNAVTFWLRGSVKEHLLDGGSLHWKAGQIKFTPRETFHKVEALEDTYALCFRGPWLNTWNESRLGKIFTLTHGRKEV